MADAAAPAAPVAPPTKIPPPVAAGPQGAAALVDTPEKKDAPAAEDPFEFELEMKGQKQKLKFAGKEQLKAVLQKALYADQVIKDATQAKKGAETLLQKIRQAKDGDISGLEEIFSDPDIGVDFKKVALQVVRKMMDDEKLTPEQREARDWKAKAEKLEAEKKAAEDAEKNRIQAEKNKKQLAEISGQIINAMKKYPDIPQTQATMDAVILNMRAAYKRFGKHLTPDQAMSVYSQQYWSSLSKVMETLPPEKLLERFGAKSLEKIQQFKLEQLKKKTDPGNKPAETAGDTKKKKHLTEKEFDKHFQTLAGGL